MSIDDHKSGIALCFSRAASQYDRYSSFQRTCGKKLCDLVGTIKGKWVLDAGCGTGCFSQFWKNQGNKVISLDLAGAMLDIAQRRKAAKAYIIGDIEQLPLATASVDVIYSNLAVQWCNNLPNALAEMYRVLRQDGILAFSTLAQGSLKELAHIWKKVDNRIHINQFLPHNVIVKAIIPYRHRIVTELHILHYEKITDLLRGIKGVGASYLHAGRNPGLTTRSHLQALETIWQNQSVDLRLMSYYVVYGVIYRDK
ncbi:malonyl-ACP O-methyltransferase BioC [Sodalis sp. CWE]|uniref:malonyl-ACP O-methyltransferase BioC n=1 Tax=Sodalis sp. CWE TaxID=2803816 RepID=UPI001C7DED26|nr:malonyl-ACP O-methyltransferase BioC [Sodalis sp. CWE]MBX4180954.1 malonyl-ACP O-methyltransferase BioC [Sodalis sp. CWE]